MSQSWLAPDPPCRGDAVPLGRRASGAPRVCSKQKTRPRQVPLSLSSENATIMVRVISSAFPNLSVSSRDHSRPTPTARHSCQIGDTRQRRKMSHRPWPWFKVGLFPVSLTLPHLASRFIWRSCLSGRVTRVAAGSEKPGKTTKRTRPAMLLENPTQKGSSSPLSLESSSSNSDQSLVPQLIASRTSK